MREWCPLPSKSQWWRKGPCIATIRKYKNSPINRHKSILQRETDFRARNPHWMLATLAAALKVFRRWNGQEETDITEEETCSWMDAHVQCTLTSLTIQWVLSVLFLVCILHLCNKTHITWKTATSAQEKKLNYLEKLLIGNSLDKELIDSKYPRDSPDETGKSKKGRKTNQQRIIEAPVGRKDLWRSSGLIQNHRNIELFKLEKTFKIKVQLLT